MNRLRIVFFFFCISLSAIVLKLFFIQIIQRSSFHADYTITEKVEPVRGRILDRNKEPLALTQTKYLLYGEPQNVKDEDDLIEEVDRILKIGEATLEARFDKNKQWISLASGLTKEKKEELENLSLKGIGFTEEPYRYYPEASLAAHIIGFLGKDTKGQSVGYFGVEGYYDKDLTGLEGVIKSERDLKDRPIFFGSQAFTRAEDGRDLVLTIDKTVQHIVKEELNKGVEQFEAKRGCALAADPYSMEILAMACLPDYDPENYFKFNEGFFNNWMISSAYEPGSTFKPLVMAAALEEGAVKAADSFNESGPVKVGGYTIKNWNDKYNGRLTMTNILERSSNIGMVHIGEQLGKDKLYDYIQNKYAFGNQTGIDLQGETTGQVKALSQWYPIDSATMTFGQGISVTALQLVRAFSSTINGGYLMRPYVVRSVIDRGEEKIREPKIDKRVLSEGTSRIMKKMLVSTVNHAEAKWDMPEGYEFGGKTGTAQVAVQGSYDASKTIASFIGFAPAEEPKFIMMVVIEEPKNSSWGSETAAPVFFDIARRLLIYYNISPT